MNFRFSLDEILYDRSEEVYTRYVEIKMVFELII